MSASCPKVPFMLPSVSRECGRLCVPWSITVAGVPTKFFEEPKIYCFQHGPYLYLERFTPSAASRFGSLGVGLNINFLK